MGSPNNEDVPPEERREQLLEFMAEHDIPLPPLAIFGGMVRQYRITFSYRTVQNIVNELTEEGDLVRVDTTELRDGEVVQVPESDSGRRAYYIISDKGKERVRQ